MDVIGKKKDLAPIVLFAFKRLDTLKLTIEALQKNFLASNSDLIVFSDAAKKEEDIPKVDIVRNYIKTIVGFQRLTIHEAEVNKGLAMSIIDGVSDILKKYEKIIVLEDDLVTSPNFLNYMNDALHYYENNNQVFSISGYSAPIKPNGESDVYFTKRASSWGWATWRHQWSKIDWEVSSYSEFHNNKKSQRQFNQMGSDMSHMLKKQMTGKLNSWAIRWCFHQFQNNLFSVHPFVSKIENIGFSIEATNTNETKSRFQTNLDKTHKTEFLFSNELHLEPKVIQQFIRPYSIASRIKYKVINILRR